MKSILVFVLVYYFDMSEATEASCMLCESGVDGLQRPLYYIDPYRTTCAIKMHNMYLGDAESAECSWDIIRYRDMCCGDDEPEIIEQAPTQAPATQIEHTGIYPICDICHDGSFPGNPAMVINMLYVGSGSCRQFFEIGRAGLIVTHLCDSLQYFSWGPCGCGTQDTASTSTPEYNSNAPVGGAPQTPYPTGTPATPSPLPEYNSIDNMLASIKPQMPDPTDAPVMHSPAPYPTQFPSNTASASASTPKYNSIDNILASITPQIPDPTGTPVTPSPTPYPTQFAPYTPSAPTPKYNSIENILASIKPQMPDPTGAPVTPSPTPYPTQFPSNTASASASTPQYNSIDNILASITPQIPTASASTPEYNSIDNILASMKPQMPDPTGAPVVTPSPTPYPMQFPLNSASTSTPEYNSISNFIAGRTPTPRPSDSPVAATNNVIGNINGDELPIWRASNHAEKESVAKLNTNDEGEIRGGGGSRRRNLKGGQRQSKNSLRGFSGGA